MADLTTKVIGFRQWKVVDGWLGAIGVSGQVWGRGTNRARCERSAMNALRGAGGDSGCKTSPGHNCDCGLYAYHERDWQCNPGPFRGPQSEKVWGVVGAWGRMEVHHDGFRAEYAEIVAVGYNPNWLRSRVEAIQAIARDYEVECVPFDRLAAVALEIGDPIPAAMRPKAPKKKKLPKPVRKSDHLDQTLRYYNEMLRQQRAVMDREMKRPWWGGSW